METPQVVPLAHSIPSSCGSLLGPVRQGLPFPLRRGLSVSFLHLRLPGMDLCGRTHARHAGRTLWKGPPLVSREKDLRDAPLQGGKPDGKSSPRGGTPGAGAQICLNVPEPSVKGVPHQGPSYLLKIEPDGSRQNKNQHPEDGLVIRSLYHYGFYRFKQIYEPFKNEA